MTIRKHPEKGDPKGRSLEEDIERLKDSGLLSDKEIEVTKEEKDGKPTPKEQQKTGDTERSDRRL